jgi:hypothetical protein
MRRRQIWIGFLVLVIGGSMAEAATRASRAKQAPRRVVTAPRAKRTVRTAANIRRARPAVATKRAAPAKVAKVAKVPTPARAVVPKVRSKRLLLAQETAPQNPATPVTPPPADRDAGLATAPTTIPREAEPLMTRALAAYFVTGDEMIGELRARGWEYGDIAAAGNLAARSRRPFSEVARIYEDRRDWTAVAREVNVAPEQVYVASNSPRYVMIRPTPQEMERMQIARQQEAYRQTLARYQEAVARYQAANDPALAADRRLAEANAAAPEQGQATAPGTPAAPPAAVPAAPDAARPDAAVPPAPVPPATERPDPNIVLDPSITEQPYTSTAMTPIERVASARLELAPADSGALLRRAVAQYYALHPSTVRDLQAQGWSLADVLVAGNLAHRSEATLDEVIALRQSGEEWRAIAERIGVASEEIHEPTMVRRIAAGYPLPVMERRDSEERLRTPDTRDSEERLPSNGARER